MDISQLSEALQRDATWVVFLNVLLQQMGLPVPAVPTLLLAGSLILSSTQWMYTLLAAIFASVLADAVWYLAGRLFGYRVLSGLCKLSINPASCVSETEARFLRWGLGSLVIAKFIPGFSTVAPPIAGSLRMHLAGFLLAAAAGAALWAGLALGAGWMLRAEVTALIAALDRHAGSTLLLISAILAIWLGWKLWQKFRFQQLSTVPHITLDELVAAMEGETPPLLLDLRGHSMITEAGPIIGATIAEHDRLLDAVGNWPKTHPIVTLCACPEDAGAVQAAQKLREQGFTAVRPLRGGYEAWLAGTGNKSL